MALKNQDKNLQKLKGIKPVMELTVQKEQDLIK
jgi:hypothetical protein